MFSRFSCFFPATYTIEELTSTDKASAASQRLEREDYWCRELCTYYPYGLNDNVRGVGNISKQHGLVVWFIHCLIGDKGSLENEVAANVEERLIWMI